MIDYLRGDWKRHPKGTVGIACFYCDYRDQTTQKGAEIIGSLVAQFLAGLREVPSDIAKEFTDAEKSYTKLELCQGVTMLESLVKMYDKSFLCIDGVDELEVGAQQTLLHAMKELLSSSAGQKTSVFFTGRPHIKLHVLQHFPPADREIEIEASEDDISCFVSHYIDTKDPIPDRLAMNDELRHKIITTVTRKSGGMYVKLMSHLIYISCSYC